MKFKCPQCHTEVIVGEDERGQQVTCLACGAQVTVPGDDLDEDEFAFSPPEDAIELDSSPVPPAPSVEPTPKPRRKPRPKRTPRASVAGRARRVKVIRRTNPLAAASFILGVAGLAALAGWALVVWVAEPLAASRRVLLETGFVAGVSCVVWAVAVVMGFMAQGEIARSNGAQGGKLAAFLGALMGLGCLVGMGMLVYVILATSGVAL